ncbi:hypothetical protein D9M68_250280 [compost metagenome]
MITGNGQMNLLRNAFLASLALVSASATSAPDPLASFLACDAASYPALQEIAKQANIPTEVRDGKVILLSGTKVSLGKHWEFSQPVEFNDLTLTGILDHDTTIMGTRLLMWGFYTQQAQSDVAQRIAEVAGEPLQLVQGAYVRSEIWSPKATFWTPSDPTQSAGKLLVDAAERVLLVEPRSDDATRALLPGAMLTCSVQGAVSEAALQSSRPDLL